MFPRDSGTELESGFLRRRRIFKFDKRRKNLLGRGSCSMNREEEGYELVSYMDKGSCQEEEEYDPIYEGDKYLEVLTEAP